VTGGDLETALQAYLQALKLRPAWWPYRQRLQQIHLLRGETDAAAQHGRAVESAVAASARVRRFWWSEHYAAGAAFVARNKWPEAEREFIRATVFLPEDPVSHFNLASLYEHLSRPDEAVAAYQKAIEVAPDFAPARERLRSLRAE
jgi:tetratricopeptide (TPR) repeat protein